MNYLGKLSPPTAEVYDPLQKLTSLRCEWTWNNIYQNLYKRAKNIIKKNETMEFYNEKEQLYLETDALGIGLGASLQQAKDGMQFSKNEEPNNATLWPIAKIFFSEVICRGVQPNAKKLFVLMEMTFH